MLSLANDVQHVFYHLKSRPRTVSDEIYRPGSSHKVYTYMICAGAVGFSRRGRRVLADIALGLQHAPADMALTRAFAACTASGQDRVSFSVYQTLAVQGSRVQKLHICRNLNAMAPWPRCYCLLLLLL